jgi:hypothetical protein
MKLFHKAEDTKDDAARRPDGDGKACEQAGTGTDFLKGRTHLPYATRALPAWFADPDAEPNAGAHSQ